MTNWVLEYVWIDAVGGLRSKNRIVEQDENQNVLISEWSFDGSSTGQAEGTESDVLLKPCAIFKNPFITFTKSLIVLCDCYNKDGTPHVTNHRVGCVKTYEKCNGEEPLFGIEQEYILFGRNNLPYEWKEHGEPGCGRQGPYYCGVGGDRCFGRKISEKHLELCLDAGIKICGTNAEVMASQWEYQIGPLNPLEVSDHLWVSRYILMRVTEDYDCYVSFHPKPYKGDWNGSGGHTNFSTKSMRTSTDNRTGLDAIEEACKKLEIRHKEHMLCYGEHNEERLSGKHETSSIDNFSWGIGDRGRSIRIPLPVFIKKEGYLEDRRPASNLDPYLVTEKIINSVILN